MKAPFGWVWDILAPSLWVTFSLSPHKLAISGPPLVGVSCSHRSGIVARFALGLESVRGPAVCVKRGVFPGETAAFTRLNSLNGAVSVAILCVLTASVPAEIYEVVIRLVGVGVVATVVAHWRWTDERQQNQTMNTLPRRFPVYVKADRNVSSAAEMCFQLPRRHQSPGSTVVSSFTLECPYRSVITNKVVREAWDAAQLIPFHTSILPTTTPEVKALCGGYGSQGDEDGRGRENSGRERIWFSPACLRLDRPVQLGLAVQA